MSKTTAFLVAAVALLGLGLLGLLLHDRGKGADRGRSEPRHEGAGVAEGREADGLSAPSADDSKSPQRSEADAPSPASAAADRQSFALAEARWVDVTVLLPAGVPRDDAPALVALSSTDEGGDGPARFANWRLSEAASKVGLGERFEERLDDEISWSRRALSGSTTLRMPFPPDARTGLVLLQSRYVYAEAAEVHLYGEPPPVTIEGELGAYLTGKLVPPADPARSFEPSDFEPSDFEIGLLGRDRQGSLDFAALGGNRLDVEVQDGLVYEVRALSARLKYLVHVEAEGLVDFAELDLLVEPGEHRVLDVPLARGSWVTGRVVGSDGSPIAGADVSAASRGKGLLFLFENGEEATSDEAGAYSLRGLPPGKANFHVEAEGWLARTDLELVLEEGVDVAPFDVVLERGSEVSGRVQWPSGAPAAGARVRIGRTRPEGWSDFQSDATCDAEGRFALAGLEEGPFDLAARAEPAAGSAEAGGEEGEWSAIARGVTPDTRDLTLALEPPLGLSGRVADDRGQPIASFQIEAEPENLPEWLVDVPGRGFEAEDGAFHLGGLRAGAWRLTASADGHAPSEPVSVVLPGAAEALLVLQRAVAIEGVVVDPLGKPVAEATVRASAGPEGPFGQESSAQQTGCDAEGRFVLEFPGAALSLVASHESWADSEPVTVEIGPGAARRDVLLALRVGGTISGEVYAADGSPDPGVSVGVSEMPFWFGQDGAGVTTDADGRFLLEHVTPGKVTVTAMPREDDLRSAIEASEDEEVAMMGFLGQMRTATVQVADQAEVHVVLGAKAKSPVSVTGTVTEGGRPLPGAGVFAVEEGGSFLQSMKVAKTDAEGRYELRLDRPGAFLVSVSLEGIGQSTAEFYVDVPEVREYELDLALPLASLGGRVLGPDSEPAAGVALNIAREGDSSMPAVMSISRGKRTDSDGRFLFEHLHPGTYTLQVGASILSGENALHGGVVLEGLVVAEDERQDGLEIRLPAAARVSGVVRRPDRSPAMGATVFARDAQGRILSDLSICQTDAAGRFSYPGLPVGSVTLFARSDDLASRETSTEVDAGGATEVELVLEPGLTLVVSLLDGEEAVRGSVVVLDERGRRVSGFASMSAFEDLMSDGVQSKEVRVGPLPPGTYTAVGRAADGKEARKTVTLREPGERVVKLRLK
jgi:hypothetical protein